MLKKMKKLIDLPDEIIKDLKHLAVEENLSLSSYIKSVLISKVNSEKNLKEKVK